MKKYMLAINALGWIVVGVVLFFLNFHLSFSIEDNLSAYEFAQTSTYFGLSTSSIFMTICAVGVILGIVNIIVFIFGKDK